MNDIILRWELSWTPAIVDIIKCAYTSVKRFSFVHITSQYGTEFLWTLRFNFYSFMHHLNILFASCLLYCHVYITFNDRSCPSFCIFVNYISVFVIGCMHITETTPLFCYWIFFPLSQMCWPANDMLFGCFIAIGGWKILWGELLWKGVKCPHIIC